jgi:hypothetical protein
MRRPVAGVLSCVVAGFLACRTASVPAPQRVPTPPAATAKAESEVDASSMDRKLLFGYQGWFGCPEDGSGLGRWEHWFRRDLPAAASTFRVDMWPDVSELEPAERCATPFTLPDGSPAHLYSAYNAKTVDRHFRWMQEHGLAGVFVQRFVVRLDQPEMLDFRDRMLQNAGAGALHHGRVFALMYDISGHPREGLVERVKGDWRRLVDTLRVTENPRYLRHRGRPVLAIWGFGFRDRSATPDQAAALIDFFKNNPEPRYRVTLVGGVPSRWRTLTRDSEKDPRWAAVYRAFDVLSPWAVGRFRDAKSVDKFYRTVVAPDITETRRLGIDYLPVIFPGFSWHNLKGKPPLNQIPRRAGRFYWRQVKAAVRLGSTMLYGAMFDEVDEGTAIYKLAETARAVPREVPILTLNADAEPVPRDWYLRLAGEAQRVLRGAPLAEQDLPFALPQPESAPSSRQ